VKQNVRPGRIGGITVGAHWSAAVILVIITQVLAVSVLPAAHPHEQPARGPAVVVAEASWLAAMNGLLAVFNLLLPARHWTVAGYCGPSCGGATATESVPSEARPARARSPAWS
jgi:hypothetical protein